FNLLRPLHKWTRSISKSRSAGYWPAPNLSWTGVSTPGRWAHEGAFKKAKTVVGWVEDIWSKTAPPAAPHRYPWGVPLWFSSSCESVIWRLCWVVVEGAVAEHGVERVEAAAC